MVTITKTTPDSFFSFIKSISSLQPCTIEQVRKHLKSIWGPVRSARNFALEYKFIEIDDKTKKISFSTLGRRFSKYSGNSKIDFLINNCRLQDYEPFISLQHELFQAKQMSVQEIGNYIETKFCPKGKWNPKDREDYGNIYAQWLELLRIGKKDGNILEYSKGKIKTNQIVIIPEMKKLRDLTLYHFLTERFPTPKNILDEPCELLYKTNQSKNNEKGDSFESFIGSAFTRLGFSSRLKDGVREKKTNLTFKRRGGGDVALFSHFPVIIQTQTFLGYAIACEAKATKNVVGSKAVGQARNLCKKIEENYKKHLVHTIVVSQSKSGYDSSGFEQAPPEVIHLNSNVIMKLLEFQKQRLSSGQQLITPIHIMLLIEELIKNQKLNPEHQEVVEMIADFIDD